MPGKRGNTPRYTATRGQRDFSGRSSTGSRLQATRIGDMPRTPRGSSRTPSGGSRHTGVYVAVVAIVACVVTLVVGGVALSGSSLFTIEKLAVSGVEHLTDSEVVSLIDLPDGETLLRVNLSRVEENLLQDAWVKEAAARRIFPDTMEIRVTERQIKAVAEIPSQDASTTRMWALSEDGVWLMPVPDKDSEAGALVNPKIYEDVENVLHIVDVPYGSQPEIGTACVDSNVNCALGIVAGMTTSLADQVVTVKATDSASTTLILDSGVEVVFGSADDIREKERVCLALLEKYGNSVVYINVSVVESPTCRHI